MILRLIVLVFKWACVYACLCACVHAVVGLLLYENPFLTYSLLNMDILVDPVTCHGLYYIFSIDATKHKSRLCRYANDAPMKESNATMKMKVFNKYPRLCLFALKDLKAGEEILYDYGEKAESLAWRNAVSFLFAIFSYILFNLGLLVI